MDVQLLGTVNTLTHDEITIQMDQNNSSLSLIYVTK